MMKASELVSKCKDIANNYKTLYVMGCFGAPMTESNKTRYIKHHSYNQRENRKEKIQAASADTFGFDCVCLIKGILWGWNGDSSKVYGGAEYKANGVPDIGTEQIIAACSGVSTDFSNLIPGELVWMQGHVGIYIGDGLVVECTPKWKDKVQITACNRTISGYNRRDWTKHGKLPYVEYESSAPKYEVSVGSQSINVSLSVLTKGKTGEQVKTLQRLLLALGYDMGGYGADGSFGPATDKAVRAYQKDKGLDVDGSVGPATWTKLLTNN